VVPGDHITIIKLPFSPHKLFEPIRIRQDDVTSTYHLDISTFCFGRVVFISKERNKLHLLSRDWNGLFLVFQGVPFRSKGGKKRKLRK